MKGKNINPSQANVLVLGLSFKENVPDLRNSKVADIVYRLKNEGVAVDVVDPHVDAEEAEHEYNIKLIDIDGDKKYDAVVVAVAHNQYREADLEFFTKFFKDEKGILIDVKGIVDKDNVKDLFDYWTM